jgi:hypothetical protein
LAALKPNPLSRPTAQELLQHAFWSELPSLEELEEGEAWAKQEKAMFASTVDPSSPTQVFLREEFLSVLDVCDAEADARYMQHALSMLTEEHVGVAREISRLYDWPKQALELCLLIVDRTLGGAVFYPNDVATLTTAAAYIAGCLYSDLEPLPNELCHLFHIDYSKFKFGVHSVLRAMQYQLIPEHIQTAVKANPKWKRLVG